MNRSFGIGDYLEATRDSDLDRSVHVEADVDEPFLLEETRYVLSLAEQQNPLEGVVAGARPEHRDFPAYLDAVAGHPKLKGFRRILHTQPDDLASSAVFIENIRLLSRYGLSFDICVWARQLPIAISLVRSCPEVQFILDHCGMPNVKEQVLDPWRAAIREISSFPNISCKISGLMTRADWLNWKVEDLRPFVDHVIVCFGWDRVMFGSDWPVCIRAGSFQRWIEAVEWLTRDASESQRKMLFHDNAVKLYRLP